MLAGQAAIRLGKESHTFGPEASISLPPAATAGRRGRNTRSAGRPECSSPSGCRSGWSPRRNCPSASSRATLPPARPCPQPATTGSAHAHPATVPGRPGWEQERRAGWRLGGRPCGRSRRFGQPAARSGSHLPSHLASRVQSGPRNLEDTLALAKQSASDNRPRPPDKFAPCLVSPKTDSPSPAQRSVRAHAQKAISYQFVAHGA